MAWETLYKPTPAVSIAADRLQVVGKVARGPDQLVVQTPSQGRARRAIPGYAPIGEQLRLAKRRANLAAFDG